MPVTLRHSRGDVHFGNQLNLKNGQIFLSYVNSTPQTSENHSYSLGQLWVKDPSKDTLTEIANARSIDALNFRGFINKSFTGNFVTADENTQAAFRFCHKGDFWIFEEDNLTDFNVAFYKGDLLLITSAEYSDKEAGSFRENLKSVEYIRINVSNTEEFADLRSDVSLRLRYKGEFANLQEFYALEKSKGNLYIATKPISILKINLVPGTLRDSNTNYVNLQVGDFIWWTGTKWQVIPSGHTMIAENVEYTPNATEIDAAGTFSEEQKILLKSATTVKEALDILNRSKAQLDENGKVSYEQLPSALKNSLSIQGKFYPVIYTSKDQNDASNQNPWPTTADGSEMLSGYYWIVDASGKTNVQYVDKDNPGRILELNTGDWIVWIESEKRFEVIDNSDKVTSIDVIDPKTLTKTSLAGNVGIYSEDLDIEAVGNNVKISIGGENGKGGVIRQDEDGAASIPGHFPIYTEKNNKITNSELYQTLTEIISAINFQIGTVNNSANLDAFGNLGIHKTVGTTGTTYVNNFLYFDTASTLEENNVPFFRTTRLKASERRAFATGDETLDIILPEASSLLVGILEDDALTPNYHTKTSSDGFITDSLTAELLTTDEDFEENFEDGFENVGIGRIASEDAETGEITFYPKSKDHIDSKGFFTKIHSFANAKSASKALKEHFLSRTKTSRTHLVINSDVLIDDIETFVELPNVSGTLITWEEIIALYSTSGIPLMIPAWEIKDFPHRKDVIGLDTSPITIRINRPAHDNTTVERVNDLSKKYGPGKESAYSYIGSSQNGSLQAERTCIDDFVSFDAWVESQRAVATKEAFVIPASAIADDSTIMSKYLEKFGENGESTKDMYSKDATNTGKFQRILPSRTLYPNEPVYYDPITGKLIAQQTTQKDVEMPAVGGVLLTSRSRIEGGYFH